MISSGKNMYQQKNSIREMLKLSYSTIISIMAVPTVVLLIAILVMTFKYNRYVKNMNSVTELQHIIQNQLTEEVWNIISGKESFEQGRQFEYISYARKSLDQLADRNQDTMPYVMAARSACGTLEKYLEQLGEQMEDGVAVTYNEAVYREIVSVAELTYNVLGQYAKEEITAIDRQSKDMLAAVAVIFIMVLVLLLAVLCYAVLSYHNVQESIRRSILNLEETTASIAGGCLEARAADPQVSELKALAGGLNYMAGRLQELIDETLETQQNLEKAKMRALQAQITPHFVYNTFESIVWLAENNRNQDVVNITMALTDFFRITLSQGLDYITVEKEEQHIRSYLSIQSIRYGSIMTYEIEIEEELKNFYMLKLLLQPLVENAIYHGIRPKRSRGQIFIGGRRNQNNTMTFCVNDDGIGMMPEKVEDLRERLSQSYPLDEDGFGLFNVNQRIRLYYGGEGLSIISEYKKGTSISFVVPCKEARND